MAEKSHQQYYTQDLDQEILSASYKVHTNWHVITGAPCTGKTTLIELLSQAGYLIAHETAREYFEVEMAKGRTSQEIRDSGHSTQMAIFHMQRDLENELPHREDVFLDRGLPDSLTFHRLFGLNPDELLPACLEHQYASVFILDRLPFEREAKLGPEDEKSAHFIDKWLERDYTSLRYQIVRVPVYPPKERLTFILNSITGQGGM